MVNVIRIIAGIFVVFLCTCSSENHKPRQEGIRIITLSPGITASLIDLGFGEQIVGRSAFCDNQIEAIPVVGDLRTIDYERLLRLQPTHVFVQPHADGEDLHLQALASENTFILRNWKLNTINDIRTLASDLSGILGSTDASRSIAFDSTAISVAPTLIMTKGSEQQVGICYGTNTYLDDVWSAMGGVNALKSDGWRMLSIEDIVRLSPDRILLVSDSVFTQNSPIELLGIPVVRFVHKDVLIPSVRIVDVAEALQDQLGNAQ
jgi:ABC-type hemin transport system substrate-binding protein